MTTLTIEIPEKVEKTLSDLVIQLGGKVVTVDNNPETGAKTAPVEKKLTKKEQAFLKGFDEAIEFVNLHQQGKVQAKTIEQVLNEL